MASSVREDELPPIVDIKRISSLNGLKRFGSEYAFVSDANKKSNKVSTAKRNNSLVRPDFGQNKTDTRNLSRGGRLRGN